MKLNNNTKTPLRTKHLDSSGNPLFTNRLAQESSPYLLQHAHNPVNWYPWGDNAFDTAKQRDLPVLLSIGYSTCHWCHVMEEESFEDMEIATFLNENYIAIKVDREERPDIDALYMKAVMALHGSGGWPMTVFMFWDKKTFYGGTYFPARDGDRGAPTGFLSILKKLTELYLHDQDGIKKAGTQMSEYLKKASLLEPGETLPEKELIFQSIQNYKKGFDQSNGGLAGRNKFPSSLPLGLLMRHYLASRDDQVLDMISLTLDKMMTGGIHDHVAGGFHRYTTDSIWLTPHYEKMLYDNALIAVAYTEGYQLTGNEEYKKTSQKTLDYLLKEMQAPEGGFYSATDADSLNPSGEQEEGYFFTWTIREIKALLDTETSKIVMRYYGLEKIEHKQQILHIPEQKDLIAKEFSMTLEELEIIITNANKVLYKERLHRKLPGLDDKIILSWNSLVISALAKAGFAFNEKKYIDAAIKTQGFIFNNLWQDKTLFHSFKDNKKGHSGFLDDYAFLTAALLDLYEATFDIKWFLKAMGIEDLIHEKFEDKSLGGFFMTAEGQDLIAREKPGDDGAIPSGNSIAIMNLVRLYLYTDRKKYRKRAEKSLQYFSDSFSNHPETLSGMLMSLELLFRPGKEIVIIVPENGKQKVEPFWDVLRRAFLPAGVVIVAKEGKDLDVKLKVFPHVMGKKAMAGRVTAYPCQKKNCRLPLTDPDLLLFSD